MEQEDAMITDEERRNVAANIRNAANRRKDDLQDDPDYSPFAALYAVFCGVRGYPRYKDLLHLADLIDRPTCTIVRSWQEITLGLGELDLDDMCGFELSCGHEVNGYEKLHYCSECGAVVIGED